MCLFTGVDYFILFEGPSNIISLDGFSQYGMGGKPRIVGGRDWGTDLNWLPLSAAVCDRAVPAATRPDKGS
jgi:hypothetical protein